MPNSIEAQGATVDEAIQIALNKLGASRDKVEIDIVHHPRNGFLGIGARRAKVKATVREGVMIDGEEFDMSRESRDGGPRRRRGNRRNRDERSSKPAKSSGSGASSDDARGSRTRNDNRGRGSGSSEKEKPQGRRGKSDGRPAREGSQESRPKNGRRERGQNGRGGNRADGNRTDGNRADGNRGDGNRADGNRAEGNRAEGNTKDAAVSTEKRVSSAENRQGDRNNSSEEGRGRGRRRGGRGRGGRGGQRAEAEASTATSTKPEAAESPESDGLKLESSVPGIIQVSEPKTTPSQEAGAQQTAAPAERKPRSRAPKQEASTPAADEPAREEKPIDLNALGETASKLAAEMLTQMGFEAKVDFRVEEADGEAVVQASCEAEGLLIGRRGQTLDALEHILNRMAVRVDGGGEARVLLDIGEYRERRRESLAELAGRLKQRAISEGRNVQVSPMSPRDRKFFQQALQGDESVEARSLGAGFYRRVVVVPREVTEPRSEAGNDAAPTQNPAETTEADPQA